MVLHLSRLRRDLGVVGLAGLLSDLREGVLVAAR